MVYKFMWKVPSAPSIENKLPLFLALALLALAGFAPRQAPGPDSAWVLIGCRLARLEAGPGGAPVNPPDKADLNGDGRQELAALEGNYAQSRRLPALALTAWEGNGFGFTLIDRVEGPFRSMRLLEGEVKAAYISVRK